MDSQKVDMFIMANGKYFESRHLFMIREKLLQMDDSKSFMIQSMQFKDPVISLIISLLVGYLGIDRFFVGDIGLGIAKLLTCGGLGIWAIIDWFLIMGVTKERNMQQLQQVLY